MKTRTTRLRWACLATVLLLAGSGRVLRGLAEEPAQSGAAPAGEEPVQSVFNEDLRCFKFRLLDDEQVETQTAAFFMAHYGQGKNPAIIGAFADVEANALAVVAPPEAEPAIRRALAEWMVVTHDLGGTMSLEAQKQIFLSERRELLGEMAALETALVESDAEADQKEAARLKERLNAFEKELQVVERQIEVVDRYVARRDGR